MKNVDDFVRKDSCAGENTFEYQRKLYIELTCQIEKLLHSKQLYDELINENNLSEDAKEFRNTLYAYDLAKSRHQQNHDLIVWLLKVNPKLKEYIDLCSTLKDVQEVRNDILTRKINFKFFGGDDHFNENCFLRHAIIKNEDSDLECMFCGATTKEYSFNEAGLEFLELCAERQEMFLTEVTKNELPLLKLLIEERNERVKTRTSIYDLEEDGIMDHSDWIEEEYYLEDDMAVFNMELEIVRGKMLDEGILENDKYCVGNPNYLSQEKASELLKEIDNQITHLQSSTSEFKELQLEICRTYKYEVLILLGNRIPELYCEAKEEDEKVSLVKAYYNLSNDNYRVMSGYFSPNHGQSDAYFYTCRTAHSEINEKIMEMRLKRK